MFKSVHEFLLLSLPLASLLVISSAQKTLTPVTFCNPATENCDKVTSGSVISNCKPTDLACQLLESDFKDGRQSCGGTGIYEFTEYRSSRCLTSRVIEVSCVRNDQPEFIRRRWIACAPTEICIQNNLNPSYAMCQDVVHLVQWKTAPDGKTESKESVRPNKKGKYTVGNNYYDNNHNPITVADTTFTALPGLVDEGSVEQANRAYSNKIDFNKFTDVELGVFPGGLGSINVVSFIF